MASSSSEAFSFQCYVQGIGRIFWLLRYQLDRIIFKTTSNSVIGEEPEIRFAPALI